MNPVKSPRRRMRLPQLGKFHRRTRLASEFVLFAERQESEARSQREADRFRRVIEAREQQIEAELSRRAA